MIPPVTAQPQTSRVLPAEAGPRAEAAKGNPAGAGPSGLVKSEAPNAVSAARRAAVIERLSDGDASGRQDPPPSEQDPVGPTPAFRETLLQRQARLAFDMPDTAANGEDRSPALSGAGSKVVTPDIQALQPASESAGDDQRTAKQVVVADSTDNVSGATPSTNASDMRSATSGFAAAVEQFSPQRVPSVDQTI